MELNAIFDFFTELNKDNSSFLYQGGINNEFAGKNIMDSQADIDRLIASSREFYEGMNKNNILMAYKGDFSQETILALLKIIEHNLPLIPDEQISVKRMLYHLLAEMLQNVRKHSYSEGGKKEGIFFIEKYENKYTITTGNYIKNDITETFRNLVEKLNRSDRKQLTQLFKNKLRNGTVTENGSAGLGLIDIARECSGDILCNFTPVNENISFLTLSIQY